MYEAFYGLTSKPFQLNPDPNFYFSSKQHRRARAYLEYGVMRCEGFIVVTGEVGAGKTTVVRSLLESLDAESVIAANLVSTQLDANDTLKLVAGAFGLGAQGASKGDLLMSLEAFFITQSLQGKRCLLIVDEAQNLQPQAVEELRMLSNFQNDKQALLQTFLVGQPEFRNILQSPEMLQLRQRVTATCHLGPLDEEETQEYIKHRLRCAGYNGKPELNSEVFGIIHGYTGGVPRRINNLMDRVLLNSFLAERYFIDRTLVNEIIEEMNFEMHLPASLQNVKKIESENDIFSRIETDINSKKVVPAWDAALDADLAESISQKLAHVSAENMNSRMLRIEHSILRQERIGLELLMTLQKMVAKIRYENKEKNNNKDI